MKKIIINEHKILKEVIKCEKELKRLGSNTKFTTKGYVKLICNIMEDKLNKK
jgi:F0F1-type ATP synthase delta subunit